MTRVLVVEDETQVRVLAESLLQEAGHVTVSAADKPEALAALQASDSFDLLFTDIDLKGDRHAGLDLANEAREIYPELKVLYTTAGAVTDGMQAMFVEDSQIILKPYLPSQIVALVESMIAGN